MLKKSIAIVALLFAVFFVTENTFAQGNPNTNGPCLLNVGVNCPQNPSNNSDAGRGIRYYNGRIAQEILRAKNQFGSRYLLVLNRYFDHTLNCNVEERAWVKSVAANGDGQVAVEIGPSHKVSLCTQHYSADQVNAMEAWIQHWRNEIYKWLKYKEYVAQYMSNPNHYQWAQQEMQRANTAVSSYEHYIKSYQAAVATSAPHH